MKLLKIIVLSALTLCASADPSLTEARSRPVMRITSGNVFAWGNNYYGQLGDGTNTDKFSGVSVVIDGLGQPLTGVVAVAAGGASTYVIKSDGTVWAWGSNQRGQLGDGTTTDSRSPVQVQGLAGVQAVAAGLAHAVALKSDGTVWAWGGNTEGELGDGSNTDSFTPVQVNGLAGATAVAAGSFHSLALKSDGTVLAWGSNSFLQLGYEPAGMEPLPVTAFSGAVAIAAGEGHSVAVKNDGTVWAWGDSVLVGSSYSPSAGPALVSGLAGVTAVASHGSHTVALKSDGTVWTWGNNQFGQLGNGTFDPTGRTSSWSHQPAAQVSGLTGVIAVTAGRNHTLALASDGTVWACGTYLVGDPANNGPTAQNTLPVQVSGLGNVAAVASGYEHAIVITIPAPAPALSYSGETGYGTDGVNPDVGTLSTEFTFKAIYSHSANHAPLYVNVCIDGAACTPMSQDTAATDPLLSNGDFTDGEQYAFTTSLAVGSHNYHFETSDGTTGVKLPATGDLAGPTVIDISIHTPAVTDGAQGVPYSLALSASGGTVPYTWTASGLPAGFTIDPATGVISTPSPLEGIYTVTVTVTDANGLAVSTSITITIYAYTTPPPEQAFNIIDLGTLGGQFSAVTAMNSSGQVTGYSYTTTGAQHAFLYTNGVMTDLGTLPGGFQSTSSAINDSGQVVGFSMTPAGVQHAFLYSNGIMTDLGTLGGTNSFANAINNSGDVAGWSNTASGASHAFLYSNGHMADLGTLGGADSVAYDINNSGQVVGAANRNTGGFHAFLYGTGGMTDLGTLGGGTFGHSEARAINDSGQVMGQSTAASNPQHAFFYDRGVMNDIGVGGLSSFAIAMNNSGQVVGRVDKGTGGYHAFLYDHGAMIDLGTLGGARSWAIAVNGSGTTGGASTTANGQRAFLYRNGVMKAISSTSPAWESLDSTVAINDNGQIAGNGRINGQGHAFMFVVPPPPSPDLAVRKVSARATVSVGDRVHYTITVSNGLNAGATYGKIQMVDTLPAGMTVDPLTVHHLGYGQIGTPPLCTAAGSPQVLTCTKDYVSALDQLPAGGSWSIEYDALINTPALPAGQMSATLTNTATVTACDPASITCAALAEPNLSDNTASAGITVLAPDLAVRLLSNKTTAGVGATVHFTLELSNGPNAGATYDRISVTATLPAGMALNPPPMGNLIIQPLGPGEPFPLCAPSSSSQVLTCGWDPVFTQQRLLPGDKWTLQFDAVIDATALPAGQLSATLTGTATVTACDPTVRSSCTALAEPNLADNTATAAITVSAPNNFSIAMSPLLASVTQGATTTFTITTAVTSGIAENVSLAVSGLPPGMTGSFSPASVTAGGSSTLTLSVSASTTGGTATITVTGTSASATHTATASVAISARNNATVIGPAGPITITSPPGTSLHSVNVSPIPLKLPPGIQLPYGMISFSVAGVPPGGTITVMISLPGPANGYWKILGPSGSLVPVQNAVFSGNNVFLTLTDGVAPFDADGIANGEIVDPGAPGILNVPPTVNAGPNQTIDATAPTGASVKFSGSGSDPDGGTLAFSWTGPCGSASSAVVTLTCPLGVNNMTLTVNDGHGGVASSVVSIVVLGPLGIKQSVLSAVSAFRATVADKEDREKLDEVIQHLTKSLHDDYWNDSTHLQTKRGEKVFNDDKESIDKLVELIRDKRSDIPDPVLQAFINRLINADRLLVLIVIADAQQEGADLGSIDKANEELLKGDKALAKGNSDDAMEHYFHAWKQVLFRPGLGRD